MQMMRKIYQPKLAWKLPVITFAIIALLGSAWTPSASHAATPVSCENNETKVTLSFEMQTGFFETWEKVKTAEPLIYCLRMEEPKRLNLPDKNGHITSFILTLTPSSVKEFPALDVVREDADDGLNFKVSASDRIPLIRNFKSVTELSGWNNFQQQNLRLIFEI